MESESVIIALITSIGAIVVALINKNPGHPEKNQPQRAKTDNYENKAADLVVSKPSISGTHKMERFDKITLIYAIISTISLVIFVFASSSTNNDMYLLIVFLTLVFFNVVLFIYLIVKLIKARFRKRSNNIAMILCLLFFYIAYLIFYYSTQE